jgi:protein TonB
VPDEVIVEPEEFKIDTESTEDDLFKEIDYQEETEEIIDDTLIIVQRKPTYPGGLKALYATFMEMKYPTKAINSKLEGRVYLSFVINKKGDVSDISILRSLSAECDAEAVKALKKVGKWNPGKQRGVPVNVRMTLPISFKLK